MLKVKLAVKVTQDNKALKVKLALLALLENLVHRVKWV